VIRFTRSNTNLIGRVFYHKYRVASDFTRTNDSVSTPSGYQQLFQVEIENMGAPSKLKNLRSIGGSAISLMDQTSYVYSRIYLIIRPSPAALDPVSKLFILPSPGFACQWTLLTFTLAPWGTQTAILARVGVSFISPEQACNNAEEEIPDFDFERVHQENRAQWNELLGRIQVDTGGRHGFYGGHCPAVLLVCEFLYFVSLCMNVLLIGV
jgi:Glycosyl hydrolase family 92